VKHVASPPNKKPATKKIMAGNHHLRMTTKTASSTIITFIFKSQNDREWPNRTIWIYPKPIRSKAAMPNSVIISRDSIAAHAVSPKVTAPWAT
jgi:hypothetical protein